MQAAQSASPENREEAIQTVTSLKEEVSKGKKSDDSRLGNLLDKLVGLIPSAVTAIASVFATPVLAGLAGPVTKFVLGKLRPNSKPV